MNKIKVFVDGREGTTGLQIIERLAARDDVELLDIAPEQRKDPAERARLLNHTDAAFLCLPDDAARESASLVENPGTVVIDASTAHRTRPAWEYGLPELSPARAERIRRSKRIANPGCHATGFLLAVAPLVEHGLLSASACLCCYSITGYSGGGKKLIARYEPVTPPALLSPQPYALSLRHKHLGEMQTIAGLDRPPLFNPIIGPYYNGMIVSVGVDVPAKTLREFYASHYADQPFVKTVPEAENPSQLDPALCNGTNEARIFVFGADDRTQVSVVLDNLGKGASGAAVQNMDLAMGIGMDG
jgi:N-acetyl-gamma-glutamyl-phosphate reductase